MKSSSLCWDIVLIALTGVLSYIFKDEAPGISGMFLGLSIFLVLGAFVAQKYGHRTLESLFPRAAVLKLGLIPPLLLYAVSAILLTWGLGSASFLLSLVGAFAFPPSFLLVILAALARKSEIEN